MARGAREFGSAGFAGTKIVLEWIAMSGRVSGEAAYGIYL